MKILVTCPPMLGMIDEFIPYAAEQGFELIPVKVIQTLSEHELETLTPRADGWIIGDDPATRRVFTAGKAGMLKAAVKWGIGTDNVDFSACRDLNIPVTNTPLMFGAEVADVALSYMVGLARQLYFIDREIRSNAGWPKPAGVSLAGKHVAVVGLGDIGRNVVKRLLACDMKVTAYDPWVKGNVGFAIARADWPEQIKKMDFIVFTCSLNDKNRHMLNADVLKKTKKGVFIINVARGQLIHEDALISALQSGDVQAAALDVFEQEPLPLASSLREMPQCIFGSHNSSNTKDAVRRASYEAMNKLFEFLRA